jgi:aminopeptidase N
VLTALERFNLVSDLWAMTLNGTVKLAAFLDFIKLFKNEQDKNVWTVILSALQYIDRVFYRKAVRMSVFARDLLAPAYNRLGWESTESNNGTESESLGGSRTIKENMAGEDALTKQLRGLVLVTLGTIGHDRTLIEEAKERYANYLSGSAALEPDVLGAIITILAYHGDEGRYTEFEKMFSAAPSPQEQERYMYALAAFRDEKLLQKTLAKALSGEIRGQSAPFVVRNVMLNPRGRSVGWQFVQENWETSRTIFPSQIITRMIEGVTGLIDEKMAEEVFTFFAAHPVTEGQKTTDQHLEKLKVALAFMAREHATLVQKL